MILYSDRNFKISVPKGDIVFETHDPAPYSCFNDIYHTISAKTARKLAAALIAAAIQKEQAK